MSLAPSLLVLTWSPSLLVYLHPSLTPNQVYYYTKATLKVPFRLDRQIRQQIRVKEKQKGTAVPVRVYSDETFFLESVGMNVWLDKNTFVPGTLLFLLRSPRLSFRLSSVLVVFTSYFLHTLYIFLFYCFNLLN